ncbi:MAG: hypothetical protein A2Y07_06005 [Planctomycetes bacterium GWF2_50_10]|nr:MAG: hypothetical protein A2Y07_06005 [Planctomycetes bacterium GWF2_50_10]
MKLEELETSLDSNDPVIRRQAVAELGDKIKSGEISVKPAATDVNLHCHTTYSYNAYGYSPSKFAWLARKSGFAAGGIVDFDVVDGVNEFLEAGQTLGLRAVAGMESRVFVPEFASRVINSPGEPGVSYHMGIGFVSSQLGPNEKKFQQQIQHTAQQRNRELIAKVNSFLSPVELDYDKDVASLTPAGNPTERHICAAYADKAKKLFKGPDLAKFWSQKLGTTFEDKDLDGAKLINAIRAKTMKKGGVGYVQPGSGSFPSMAAMNEFFLACGAIPAITWLDGTSDGEQAIDELVKVCLSSGAAVINIIPDRNYTPGVRDQKYDNLKAVIDLANKLDLPVVVGTEMNSPGNKFVDAFETEELRPFVPVFLKGAYIVYAHTILQKHKMGYLSDWAKKSFASTREKNAFFEKLGLSADPYNVVKISGISTSSAPEDVIERFMNK